MKDQVVVAILQSWKLTLWGAQHFAREGRTPWASTASHPLWDIPPEGEPKLQYAAFNTNQEEMHPALRIITFKYL